MARLNTTVHVLKDDHSHAVFEAGDEVPAWAVARITNPNVWDEPPTDGEGDDAQETVTDPDAAPAKAGPGATRQAWADYAEHRGVAVAEEWKRDDIIAAMENAGLA
ncbi:hypothetical protein ACQP1O_43205 (plasmid) [Nocardia sp. CA-151230]|uniref:hypothetical protein n=1 Tax=Nocardia sp. CA-151230 TaxID=3239982 RepID=UPI003D90C4C8